MKQSLTVHTQHLNLPGNKSDAWFDKWLAFMKVADELMARRVSDDERKEFGEELARALYQCSKFGYKIRGERDRALACGYDKYPKPQYNSDASEALARNYASEEVRLRALLEEMEAALRLRFEINRSALVSAREETKHAGG